MASSFSSTEDLASSVVLSCFLGRSEGDCFFWFVRLLDRHGIAQLFHDTVEICGIGLRRNDGSGSFQFVLNCVSRWDAIPALT